MISLIDELEAAIQNENVREPTLGDFVDTQYELILRNECRDYTLLCSPKNIQKLLTRIRELEEAMKADVLGAGPMTGPIYHENIRRCLGLSLENSGQEVLSGDEGQKE